MKAYRLVLFLTEECDKKCFYCDIGQLKNPKKPKKHLIEKYFPIVNGRDDIFPVFTLTGGEPGLVDVDILEYIFDEVCDCHKIRVNTNGLFIDKGYFDRWYDKINWVGYHPNIEVKEDIKHYICDDKIQIFQPVHSKNYKDVLNKCQKYPLLKFDLIPFLQKQEFDGDQEYILSQKQFQELYNSVYNLNNVLPDTFDMLKKSFSSNYNTMMLHRTACGNSQIHPTIDFVNEKILRCPISWTYSDKVELTKSNIIKMMSFNLFKNAKNDISCQRCNDCLRYFDSYWYNTIRRKLI